MTSVRNPNGNQKITTRWSMLQWAWRAWRVFPAATPMIFAYARRILVNHVTDRWRRRLREYATGEMPDLAVAGDIAEEVTVRQWLLTELASLTPRERAVVVMRYFFDLPEARVADELSVSIGTVKSTGSRALAKLRVSAGSAAKIPSGAIPATTENQDRQ